MADDFGADHRTDPHDAEGGTAPVTGRPGRQQLDLVRSVLPVFALLVVILAVVAEPADWWQTVLLAAVVALFGAWSRWNLPPPLLTAGVVATLVLVQLDTHLEPASFLACLVAVVVARWSSLGVVDGLALLAIVATPIVIAALQPGNEYGWPTWIFATVFSAAIGWAVRRQEGLSRELESARLELAQAAMLEERRHIARDVHDLVGHGLAAMLVQVTSARHVLTRNPPAADEALATAEDVGRQSMRELRRAVALLRHGDESGLDAPLPGLAQLGDLVDAARDRGLGVSYHVEGATDAVDPAIGLAVHRIAQEALTNAGRHAAQAHTVVTTTVTDDDVVLKVESLGAVPGRPDNTAHFGLQGMRERADVVGGEFHAGPSPDGWTVLCRVPRKASR